MKPVSSVSMQCACLDLPAVICLVCLSCSLILALQLARIRKAPCRQGTETSAWHPKNAIAGSLQPTASQGLLLNYSWLCHGSEETNFQSTVAPLKSLGTKEGNAK